MTTLVIGRIVRVNGAKVGESALPSLVTYNIRGDDNRVHESVTPALGRPVHGDEASIYAAREGDPVLGFVSYEPSGRRRVEWWVVSEVVDPRTARPIRLAPSAEELTHG